MSSDPSAPTSPSKSGATPASSGSDWPTQATDTIVNLVDTVREKTTGPATTAVRGAVYGLLIAIVGTAALVLFLVLLVRGIDILVQVILDAVNLERAGRSIWIAHTLTGLMFLLPGILVWRKGTTAPATE